MPRSRKSGGRKSTLESRVGPEQMKDSRSQRDDDFLQRMKKLHEFLLDLGFPGSIRVERLLSISPEDFLKMVEFIPPFSEIYFQVHTYEVEEEISKLLKDLRFPVAFYNRCMYFVGYCTEHYGIIWMNWMKDWMNNGLIVKVMYLEKKKYFFPCDVEEGAEFNKVLMENCCDAYRKFMEGDTIKEEDEVIFNMLLLSMDSNIDKQEFYSQQEMFRKMMKQVDTVEGECQRVTPADIERHDRKTVRMLRSLSRGMKEVMRLNDLYRGNGAAGLEQRGANAQNHQE